MMEWQRDHAVTVEKASRMRDEELEDKFKIGILTDRELPVFHEEYEKVRQMARATMKGNQ